MEEETDKERQREGERERWTKMERVRVRDREIQKGWQGQTGPTERKRDRPGGVNQHLMPFTRPRPCQGV